MNKEKHLFAVVDVETTGGKPSDTKITEIAIVISDGKNILQQYSTLINPFRKIDWYVTKLTGITDEMVSKAASFESVAQEVSSLLEGKIFVAHNVDFDYNIIKREFLELGMPLEHKKLCTVKSARKVFQNLSSYSLGNLSAHLEIPLPNAHRALDDTLATAYLLHKILEKEDFEFLYSEIKQQNHLVELPESWTIRDQKELSNESGLVYFHDNEDNIIYVDCTKNFQKLIFTVVHEAEKKDVLYKKLLESTSSITLDSIPDMFKAELKMYNDIQALKPKYNKPFKKQNNQFSIYLKKDEKGLYYLAISRTKNAGDIHGPIIYSASFRNAEKLKDKFMYSPEISQLSVLKKQIYVDDGLMQEIHIKQYNQTIISKLFKEYCCPIENGFYIFNIHTDREIEAVEVRNFYLHAWGIGTLENNQVSHFRPEFEFDSNQKMTRKFLNIVAKTSYKIVENKVENFTNVNE